MNPPPSVTERGTDAAAMTTIRTTCARRRLFRDWQELEEHKEELTTVTAVPTRNLFLWHGNLRPDTGPFAGIIFHVILYVRASFVLAPLSLSLSLFRSYSTYFYTHILRCHNPERTYILLLS